MSKIKASTLLRNVELASLGAIRDMIADEVERLEAVERPSIEAANNVNELLKSVSPTSPPVKKREPLADTRGDYWYMLVENGQRIIGSGCAHLEKVKKLQIDYPNSRIVQCMAPDDSGNCPTQYVDSVQLGCEIEWAIYGTGGDMWLCPSVTGRLEHSWRAEPFNARRWESRNGAQCYINSHEIDAAIPFPVPKLREA